MRKRGYHKKIPSFTICAYCDDDFAIVWDHIIPFSKGGATCDENMIACCVRCNRIANNHIFINAGEKKFFILMKIKGYKTNAIYNRINAPALAALSERIPIFRPKSPKAIEPLRPFVHQAITKPEPELKIEFRAVSALILPIWTPNSKVLIQPERGRWKRGRNYLAFELRTKKNTPLTYPLHSEENGKSE